MIPQIIVTPTQDRVLVTLPNGQAFPFTISLTSGQARTLARLLNIAVSNMESQK